MPTTNHGIITGTDDGLELLSTGAITHNANGIVVSSINHCLFRFTGLGMAQGDTITDARISFICNSLKQNDINMDIYAHDADDSTTLTTTTGSVSSRPRTSATVSWVAVDGFSDTTTRIQSPNIASVIQEVVSRPGWVAGNSISVICIGKDNTNVLQAKAYDGGGVGTAGAAQLDLTYAHTPGPVTLTTTPAGLVTQARSIRTHSVTWDGDDAARFTRDLVSEDEAPSGTIYPVTMTLSDSSGEGRVVMTNPGATNRDVSNRRDFWYLPETWEFAEGRVRTYFDPGIFGGGYKPQHGIFARWTENSSAFHTAMVVWHDITVPFPHVLNFAVWRTDRPWSATATPASFRFRAAPNTGASGLTLSLPYWLEATFVGETIAIKAWNVGDSEPTYSTVNKSWLADLSSVAVSGNPANGTLYADTPTPTRGPVGIMSAHTGDDSPSGDARFGPVTVEQWGVIDIAQSLGPASAQLATGAGAASVQVARGLTPAASSVAVNSGSSQLVSVFNLTTSESGIVLEASGNLDVLAGERPDATIEPTLTAIGESLTLTAIDGDPFI